MQKEIELEFEMRYQFDSLLVVYCTEGIHKNRIQDIIVNGTYPLDTSEVWHNKYYKNLKDQVSYAMDNNSHSYWEEEQEKKEVANA